MTGYFTEWAQKHLPLKKGVPSVLCVPMEEKTCSSNDYSRTQKLGEVNLVSVPCVPAGTLRTQAKIGAIGKSVPEKVNKTNTYRASGTQEHWEHKKNSNIVNDSFEERAAIMEYDGNLPRPLAEAFAYVDTCNRPNGISQEQWDDIKDNAGRFLDEYARGRVM